MGLTRCNPQRLSLHSSSESHITLPFAVSPPLPPRLPLSPHPTIIVNIDSVKHRASELISVSVWISLSLSEDDY